MPVRPRGSRLHRREPARAGVPPEEVLEGRILHHGRLISAEVGIAEGRIVQVARSVSGGRRVDLHDALVLPSATDLHVHFRDPGPPGAVESFATGTVQAALGGIGAVVDMPNTEPPTTDLERLEAKEARVRSRASVDVLLLAALTPRSRVAELGARASGFKLYLAPTTGDLAPPPTADVRALTEEVARTGSALHVHSEDPTTFHDLASPLVDPVGWNAARPPEGEISGLERLLPAPEGLLLHVAHATTAATVDRALSAGASVEATPHHLLLSAPMLHDATGKVNPPLRSAEDRSALFERFRQGRITMLASDHAPHALSEKERPFPLAPAGVPGVETMLPLLLEQVRRGELPLDVLLRAACRRPALFLGLPRGSVTRGMEADLLVIDFRDRRTLHGRELHAPCGWTPFEGREGVFPRAHYLRGQKIVDDGEFVGGLPGKLLRRGGGAGAAVVAAPGAERAGHGGPARPVG